MSNADLAADVMVHVLLAGPTTWIDLESAGVGGRCPWKRLGELADAGLLAVVGSAPGKYGRTVKVYARLAAS